jgi:hypothetical protein
MRLYSHPLLPGVTPFLSKQEVDRRRGVQRTAQLKLKDSRFRPNDIR